MSDKLIIEIQRAGGSVQVIPMSEGSPIYKIVAAGKTIAENLTRESAENLIKAAKNRVIIG